VDVDVEDLLVPVLLDVDTTGDANTDEEDQGVYPVRISDLTLVLEDFLSHKSALRGQCALIITRVPTFRRLVFLSQKTSRDTTSTVLRFNLISSCS